MTLFDRAIASMLPVVPKFVVHQVAKRYIAGETAADALRVANQLNSNGFRATMDILGEHIDNFAQAHHAAERYDDLLREISRRRINSTVSMKLTQLGLKLDKRACVELTAALVGLAQELGNFVRLDMEDSSCTSDTLEVYRTLRQNHSNVGVAIQAYLKRTLDDVERLKELKPNYRLCKGVYIESAQVAYRDMASINRNYITILERLLKEGSYVGIATHDPVIVREAMRLIGELKAPPTTYEFQMLLGVHEGLRNNLLQAGHPLRVYIPFGPDWYAYSVRRLRENPRLAGYVLKALLRK